MKNFYDSKLLILGGLIAYTFCAFNAHAELTEEEQINVRILEQSDYDSVRLIMKKIEDVTEKDPAVRRVKMGEILQKEEQQRETLSELIRENVLTEEIKKDLAELEARRAIQDAFLNNDSLNSAVYSAIKQRVAETANDQESEIVVPLEGTPINLTLTTNTTYVNKGVNETYAQFDLKLNEVQFKELLKKNPTLENALNRYSSVPSEQKAMLNKFIAAMNDFGQFNAKVLPGQSEQEYLKSLASGMNDFSKHLKDYNKELGDLNNGFSKIGMLNADLEKSKKLEDQAADKIARELSIMKTLKSKFDVEEGFSGVKACEILAASFSYKELSEEDQLNCKDEIALFDKKAERNLAEDSTNNKESPVNENNPDADGKPAGHVAAAAVESNVNDKIRENIENRTNQQNQQQLQQSPDAIAYRQFVGNLIVPMACTQQSLAQSMPFGGDSANEKRLDQLEEGLAAQMTACKITGYIQEDALALSSGLIDGASLASEAMSTMFGDVDASTMSKEQTAELKTEKKCLDRSAAAMRRGLALARLEVERLSKQKARSKVFNMRAANPMLFSQEMTRKRMELMSHMGPFAASLSEEDISKALYDEYKVEYAADLHLERNVDQMANNLSAVQALGADVNNLYHERRAYIENSGIGASMLMTNGPLMAPTPNSRTAPSRNYRLPSGNGTMMRQPSPNNRTLPNNGRSSGNRSVRPSSMI